MIQNVCFFSIDQCPMLNELSLALPVQIVPNSFPITTSNISSSSSSSSRKSFSQIFVLLIIFIFGLIFGHLIKTTFFQNLLLHQYLFISDLILFSISVNLYENEKMAPSHVKKENVCWFIIVHIHYIVCLSCFLLISFLFLFSCHVHREAKIKKYWKNKIKQNNNLTS